MLLPPKIHTEASVFKPANLMREARRQKGLPEANIPALCILDPDGDLLDYVVQYLQACQCPFWACYHTKLYVFDYRGLSFGIIGQAVGASFAVLLAEQLFVSGCELLLSITSAGVIQPPTGGERFILIDEALRDEGTSAHYLPTDQPAQLNPDLKDRLSAAFIRTSLPVGRGLSWTTDAPYRETQSAIDAACKLGVTCVEMESAALYAFAQAQGRNVVCFAHLTNTMAQAGDDFEKGEANGSLDALELLYQTACTLSVNSQAR